MMIGQKKLLFRPITTHCTINVIEVGKLTLVTYKVIIFVKHLCLLLFSFSLGNNLEFSPPVKHENLYNGHTNFPARIIWALYRKGYGHSAINYPAGIA